MYLNCVTGLRLAASTTENILHVRGLDGGSIVPWESDMGWTTVVERGEANYQGLMFIAKMWQ